jgi:hypothetical protein
MVPTTAPPDLQPLIDRQMLAIEMLRAHIAGFEALTAMIGAQEPLIPLTEKQEAVLTEALAAGVA